MVPTIGNIEPAVVYLDTMWPIQLEFTIAKHRGEDTGVRVKTTNLVVIVIGDIRGT